MTDTGSVTHWIKQLKSGERAAIQELWQRYFHRLVALARRELQTFPRRAADEEDIALSAFDSFCNAVDKGRFPQLDDRNDLWQILVMITRRKAIDLKQYESREMRDFRKVQESIGSGAPDSGLEHCFFAELISREPDPGFVAEMADQFRFLLDKLGDKQLRSIALWKMEGQTNSEIADQLKVALSTIERRLHLIRKSWESEIPVPKE